MRTLLTAATLAAAVALGIGSAHAQTQLVRAKKILIKTPASGTANNKLVFLAKDAIVLPGGAVEDPRCGPDGSGQASLTVASDTTANSFTIDLGGATNCLNWSLNGAGTVYKYKDTTGATCKIVLIKDGVLTKAVCKGAQVAFTLGADQGGMNIVLRTGTSPRRYCTALKGKLDPDVPCDIKKNGSDGKTYLAKNCSNAPASCPLSPSGAFVDAASTF